MAKLNAKVGVFFVGQRLVMKFCETGTQTPQSGHFFQVFVRRLPITCLPQSLGEFCSNFRVHRVEFNQNIEDVDGVLIFSTAGHQVSLHMQRSAISRVGAECLLEK